MTASDAEIQAEFALICPDCGHALFHHSLDHYWPDGRTCVKCSSNPGGLVGNRGVVKPCCLTSAEVRRVVAAGSPECPNHDDPVLCAWDRERLVLVPEAGCPLHDYALHPRGDYADYTEGRLS